MTLKEKLEPTFEWLVDGAQGSKTPMQIVGRMGHRLREIGVPVERINAFVRTLHPKVAGRRFSWNPKLEEAEVGELPWGNLNSAMFRDGPLPSVFEKGIEVRVRLDGDAPLPYGQLDQLRKQGLTDYLALPLRFIGGTNNGITYATNAPGGFTDEQVEGLRWVTRPLARVGETLALMRTAVNLLNTYVGRNAGERILGGHIQPGDTENIRCVVWFSDLRGFTSMSGQATPGETIAVLNELFECQVPAIEAHGGEVLKFIGDGMLAIFPIGGAVDTHAAAEAAAAASVQAFAALAKLNAKRVTPLRFGLALHVGDVAYGNIGGANRLDFTAIGSTVNLAARIESLTGKLGKDVLLSGAFAQALGRPVPKAGDFEMKGITGAQPVFEL